MHYVERRISALPEGEMLKVDVHGRHTELSQCVLETLRHPTGTAEESSLQLDKRTS